MVRRQHRVTAGLLGFILLLGTQLMNPPAMAATPPGGHLNITEVAVDNPNAPTRLMISGQDFLFGPGPLVVTLGDFGALAIVGTLLIPRSQSCYRQISRPGTTCSPLRAAPGRVRVMSTI